MRLLNIFIVSSMLRLVIILRVIALKDKDIYVMIVYIKFCIYFIFCTHKALLNL